MLIGNTSVWIEVDGKALTEFGLRVEGAKATCWVPSEAGKVFPGFSLLSAHSQLLSGLRRQVRAALWWCTTVRQGGHLVTGWGHDSRRRDTTTRTCDSTADYRPCKPRRKDESPIRLCQLPVYRSVVRFFPARRGFLSCTLMFNAHP